MPPAIQQPVSCSTTAQPLERLSQAQDGQESDVALPTLDVDADAAAVPDLELLVEFLGRELDDLTIVTRQTA